VYRILFVIVWLGGYAAFGGDKPAPLAKVERPAQSAYGYRLEVDAGFGTSWAVYVDGQKVEQGISYRTTKSSVELEIRYVWGEKVLSEWGHLELEDGQIKTWIVHIPGRLSATLNC
jgi:hypothetical protein